MFLQTYPFILSLAWFIENLCCSKNSNNNNELQKQREVQDAWEVKSDDVTLSEELGQGAFGKVYKGTMRVPSLKKKSLKSTTVVAVKVLQGMFLRVIEWIMIKPGYTGEIAYRVGNEPSKDHPAFNT